MSMMCTKEGCTTHKGLCGHEKTMLGMMLLLSGAAAGHWMFHWF
ncbi:hypothetical protein [Leptospirillum ferrooxidans]|nr:hypothetical protein [Leptospirillum ferrooxidans]